MPRHLPFPALTLLLGLLGLSPFCPTSTAQDSLPLPLPAALPPPIESTPSSLPSAPPPPSGFTTDAPIQPLPTVSLNRPSSASTATSTSSSRQFIVYGPELRIRSGLAARCDEIAAELNRLLRTQDPWVHPIVVQILTLGPNDPPDLGITSQSSQLENEGFHLQLTVPERNGLKPADLKRELVRLLLTERILRTHKSVTSNREPLLPYWIHTGVMAALDFRHRTRPSAVFAAIFKSGQVYGIEQILDSQPALLDGLSRTIYETSCCALVLALLDQPEGPRLFSRFLSSLASDPKPEREMLSQWFPGLAESDASLNKWWSLQLASLASPSIAETLSPTESAQLLDRALTFYLSADPASLPTPRSVTSIASQRPAAAPLPVPSPTPVIALPSTSLTPTSNPPKPTSATTTAASKPKPKPKPKPAPSVADTAAEEPAEMEETDEASKGPGLFRRLLGFGGGSMDEEDDEPSEPENTPPAPTTTAETSTKPESESKPATKPTAETTDADAPEEGMTREQRRELRRLEEARKDEERRLKKLAEDDAKAAEKAAKEAMEAEQAAAKAAAKEAEKAAEKAKNQPSPAPAKPAEPAPAPAKSKPKADPEPATEKPAESPPKGSLLNPLKWFRGKKSEDPPPAEPQASTQPLIPRNLLGLSQARFIQAPATTNPEPTPPAPVAPLNPETFTAPPLPPLVGLDPTQPPAPTTPAAAPTVPTAAPPVGIAYPIEDFAVILAQPDRDRLLKQASLSLQDLTFRGNVLFRDLARDYALLIKDMQDGKTKDLEAKLVALRQRAIETYQTACAVQDHLDWYEASQSKEYSGLFEDFLTLPERIKEELPPRLDPISNYLDQVERQLSR